MRKLSEEKLKLVQTAIKAKEISVIEILAEIYDHYISHLEGFSEEEFESELANLESKWTYTYCRTLQNDFSKSINKSIRGLQWKLVKSYFTWPKFLALVLFFLVLFSLSTLLTAKIFALSFILPILIITQFFDFYLIYLSRKKFKRLRSIFNFKTTGLFLSSAQTNSISVSIGTSVSILNLFLISPRIFDFDYELTNSLLLLILVFFAFFISIIAFSAYEAWKIKSKTALS